DERLSPAQEDLDFCWRARLAGFRVLMTPKAVARHRGAGGRGEREATLPARMRYHTERVALASLLKNYGLLTLAWVLPLYFGDGLRPPRRRSCPVRRKKRRSRSPGGFGFSGSPEPTRWRRHGDWPSWSGRWPTAISSERPTSRAAAWERFPRHPRGSSASCSR